MRFRMIGIILGLLAVLFTCSMGLAQTRKHSAAWYRTHRKHSAAWYRTHSTRKHSAAWYRTHRKHSAAWYAKHGKKM